MAYSQKLVLHDSRQLCFGGVYVRVWVRACVCVCVCVCVHL